MAKKSTFAAMAVFLLGLAAAGDALAFRDLRLSNGLRLENGLDLSNGLILARGLQLDGAVDLSGGIGRSHGLDVTKPLAPTPAEQATGALAMTGGPQGLLETSAGRGFVTHMIQCALEPEQSVSIPYVDVETGSTGVFEAAGAIGLAPQWAHTSCDEDCQRWVSACILARTNVGSAPVDIDLRANHPAIGPQESAAATLNEGVFFGNLFSAEPELYVCPGSADAEEGLWDRLCGPNGCTGITQVGAGGSCGFPPAWGGAGCQGGPGHDVVWTSCQDPAGGTWTQLIEVGLWGA